MEDLFNDLDFTDYKDELELPDFDLREILKHNLSKKETINRHKRISPSSLCSYCPRSGFFTGIKQYESYWDVTSEFYARLGNTIEDLVAKGLGDFLLKQGVRLWENDFLQLGAELDLLLKNHDNRIVIGEVKSCGELPSIPKPYQLWQMVLYQAYYLCDGILIYISRGVMDNKHNLKLRQFINPLDKSQITSAIVRSYLTRTSLDLELIPPKGDLITKISDCGFCDFTNFCWRGDTNAYAEMTTTQYITLLHEAQEYAENFFSKSSVLERRTDLYNKINTEISFEDFLLMFDTNGF